MPNTPNMVPGRSIGRFVAELRRRHVLRVLGAYLITSWGIIEVSSTIFPLVHLPVWMATAVVITLAAALPLVALAAWVFDLTPEGFHRTDRHRATPAALPIGSRSLAAVVLIALAVGGWAAMSKRNVAAKVDHRALAVFPFDVAAQGDLAYLSEGMVDLLATKLAGAGGLRAVSPRTSIRAWRQEHADNPDIDDVDARHVSRRIGAGLYLTGHIIGSPSQLSITARLFDAVTGAERARAEEIGPPDSLFAMVDRLASQLLARASRERLERLTQLTTTSLPALKLFLEGRAAYRNADFTRAENLLRSALEQDSTFALAGLAHAQATDWVPGHDTQGLQQAWRFRHRLSQRDVAIVRARAGDGISRPLATQLAMWDSIVAAGPDDVESIFDLADFYFHYGAALGYTDAHARAFTAMERALALDSTFLPPLAHMFQFDTVRSDPSLFRRFAQTYLAAEQSGDDTNALMNRWVIATELGDSAMLERTYREFESAHPVLGWSMLSVALSMGLTLDDVKRAFEAQLRNAVADDARFAASNALASVAALMGRPNETAAYVQEARARKPDSPNPLIIQVAATLFYDGDQRAGSEAAAELEKKLAAARAAGVRPSGNADCLLGHLRLANKDLAAGKRHRDQLKAATANQPLLASFPAVCALLLDVRIAHLEERADATQRLAQLDSLLTAGALESRNGLPFGNILSMQLHEARGQHREAFAAARRQVFGLDGGSGLIVQLLGQARLAAKLGHTEEAIRAYQKYLAIRVHAEPGTRAAHLANTARAELAALAAQPR